MPSRLPASIATSTRDKLLWTLLGALALAQLIALWMLCTHQVRQAEVRQTALQVQQVAIADCLAHIPGATLSACAARLNPRSPQLSAGVQTAADSQAAVRSPAMDGATPVNFVYR